MPDRMSQVSRRVVRLGWFVVVISLWFLIWALSAADFTEKICAVATASRGAGLLWVNCVQQLVAALLLFFSGMMLVYLGRLIRLSAAG